MAKGTQRILHRLAPWALPVALLLAVWQISVVGGLAVDTGFCRRPARSSAAFCTLVSSGEIWHAPDDQQLARTASVLVIGGSIRLVLGFITGLSRWGERLLDSSVQMIRNVPHLALIPLVILWFGIDETAKIFLVALGTLFPIYLNTYHGIKNIDPGAAGDGTQLRSERASASFAQVVLPGASALDPGRGAFCVGLYVADADRCRNHLRQFGYRLSGDERT
jgi:sulfonate transport system permease protein